MEKQSTNKKPLATDNPIRTLFVNALGLIFTFLLGYRSGKIHSLQENPTNILNNNGFTCWTRNIKTGEATVSIGESMTYGFSSRDLDNHLHLFLDSIHPDDNSILLDAMNLQDAGNKTTVLYRIFTADGEIRWVEDRGTPVFNKQGEVTKVEGVIFDVTSHKKTEEKMNDMAYKDTLTELPNRNWFQEYLTSIVDKRLPAAIMFIDFDNFKRVNDTLGHRAGDSLLKQMAARLQSCIRKEDIVSRQNGDEFLVLLETDNIAEIKRIAEKIIRKMNHPYKLKGTEILSTPSIGISLFPESGHTAESLIEMADFAMYLAKKSGKNTYQFYNDQLNQQMKRRMLLEAHLHRAISREEFEVYYQPQIDLTSGKLAGAEALLRWKCELGRISPDEFIPIAEDTGLIIPIGEWVLREACRHSKWFKDNGLVSFPISVNISTKQLVNQNFVARIKRILAEENIDPRLLTLEITESALLYYEDAKSNISELRKLGVGISLDDFGVGYSSLNMIRNINIDELKIDKSFLSDALINERVRSLLETIILIGKKIDAKVVIEGIETAEELELLLSQRVYGQGYFYSKPLPVYEFKKWYFAFYEKEK
ncbi:putative bifunctional diguanylate cyclase/phosphodiesterase [Oceanobacillus massiliensis]|uniref:putative bifunctional diguanylate cyclase/phosphodiesterase n=1 Tax=Oceanobacillus massiliensis TaxID=1465765 RepID=UPI003018DA85